MSRAEPRLAGVMLKKYKLFAFYDKKHLDFNQIMRGE